MIKKIGFGGGCHWCAEAVFTSLKGVHKVEQGFIQSVTPFNTFSEAVIVIFDTSLITLKDLTEIHLHTHASSSMHSMRNKYRSAIYFFDNNDEEDITSILKSLQQQFDEQIITKPLPFVNFKQSLPQFQNYYSSNPGKPFCKLYIHPKLELLKKKFRNIVKL